MRGLRGTRSLAAVAVLGVAASFGAADSSSAQMPQMDSMPKNQTVDAAKDVQKGQPEPQAPAMPFGTTADRQPKEKTQAGATPVPLRMGMSLQEPEHPAMRSGSLDPAVPDLLADVKSRPPRALAFFEDAAMKSNPTIRQAEMQVRRLQGMAKQQGLWQNPEIGYEADHIRGGSYHSGEQGGYVQQVIPISGQRSAASGAVKQQAKAAETSLEEQKVRVRSAVQKAFYETLAAQVEVDLRGKLLKIASDAAVTAHQLANVGQADAPDILQSEVEREQAKLDFASSQRRFRKSFAQLAAVSGDARFPVAPLEGDLKAFPQLEGDAAMAAADGSPMLQVAEKEVSANDAAVRSARRQRLPELTLHAGLQQNNEPLESSGGRVGVVGVAQAGLTIPLWNRNQGAVEAAKAIAETSRAEVQRTHLELRAEAEQTMQEYRNAQMQVERYRVEMLPRAQRAFELYQKKYMNMAAAYPQVLVSQRTYFQLQIEYVHELNAAWQSAILLQNGMLQDGLMRPEAVSGAADQQGALPRD